MKFFLLQFDILIRCRAFSANLCAQPALQWQQTIGGSESEYVRDLIQTADSGYLLSGRSSSPAGFDKSEALRGQEDAWIVKLNLVGEKKWDRTLGGMGKPLPNLDMIILTLSTAPMEKSGTTFYPFRDKARKTI